MWWIPLLAGLAVGVGSSLAKRYEAKKERGKERRERAVQKLTSFAGGGKNLTPLTPVEGIGSSIMTGIGGGLGMGLQGVEALQKYEAAKPYQAYAKWLGNMTPENQAEYFQKLTPGVSIAPNIGTGAPSTNVTVQNPQVRPEEYYSKWFPKKEGIDVAPFDINKATQKDFDWLKYLVNSEKASDLQRQDYEKLKNMGWK